MKATLLSIVLFVHCFALEAQYPDLSWAETGTAEKTYVRYLPASDEVLLSGMFFIDAVVKPPLTEGIESNGSYDFFLEKLDADGNVKWLKVFGGSESEGMADSPAVDQWGNIYLTGFYYGSFDADPGPGVFELQPAYNFSDIFVIKLDPDGNLLWARGVGTYTFDGGETVKIDSQGNVIICGSFESSMNDFDPGPGALQLDAYGDGDIFIAKWNSNGEMIWTKSFGSWEEETLGDVVIDNQDNIYLTGLARGLSYFDSDTLLDFPGGYFLLKLNGDSGDVIWSQGTEHANGGALALDNDQNLLVGVYGGPEVDADPGPGTSMVITNYSSFLQKLSSDGEYIWAKVIDSSSNVSINDLEYDTLENIYVGGSFNKHINLGTVEQPNVFFNKGFYNGFIQKLDSVGTPVWGTAIPSPSQFVCKTNSLSVATDGRVYATGSSSGEFDIDPSAIEYFVEDGLFFVLELGPPSNHIHWTDPVFYGGNDIVIYPNPTNGEIWIKQDANFELDIEILDYSGRVLKTVTTTNIKTKVDCSSFVNGLYLIRITSIVGSKQFDLLKYE